MISPPLPAIDIIIPNWNGRHLLEGCLESIKRQSFSGWHVTVVDNGSRDGSAAWLREHYPQVTVVPLPENRGFAQAVNLGIRSTSAPLIFLLNNDTELAPNCLEQLTQAAEAWAGYHFFAVRMLNFHQRDLLDGAGDGFLRGGVGYKLGMLQQDDPEYWRSGPVFGACAGAALYRRELFEQVGYFDEAFFAYLEDVDLNLRAARQGMRCYFAGEARVYHMGSASSGATFNPLTVRLSTRNNLNLLVKNYSLALLLRFFLPICIYQLFWLSLVLRHHQLASWVRGLGEGVAMLPAMYRKGIIFRRKAILDDRQFGDAVLAAETRVVDSLIQYKKKTGKRHRALRLYRILFV